MEVSVWLGDEEMDVEYAGRPLSRCDVSLSRNAKLEAVTNPRLFELRLIGRRGVAEGAQA